MSFPSIETICDVQGGYDCALNTAFPNSLMRARQVLGIPPTNSMWYSSIQAQNGKAEVNYSHPRPLHLPFSSAKRQLNTALPIVTCQEAWNIPCYSRALLMQKHIISIQQKWAGVTWAMLISGTKISLHCQARVFLPALLCRISIRGVEVDLCVQLPWSRGR